MTGEFRRATAWREAMLHRHFVVTIAHADRAGGTLDATAYHDVLIIDHATLAFDGLTLCRELRAAGVALPILMLHPQGTPGDLLAGFEAGADAYLCGSFSQRELLAQIGALRRRHAANESTNTGTASVVMG